MTTMNRVCFALIFAAVPSFLMGCTVTDNNSGDVGEAGTSNAGGKKGQGGSTEEGGAGGAAGADELGGNAGTGGETEIPCVEFTGGDVTEDLTLTKACSPYQITAPITVANGATLTLAAGTELAFDEEVEGVSVGYSSSGRFVVQGTAASPVVMSTSSSSPVGGSWGGISFFAGTLAGSDITYLDLYYCGLSANACIFNGGLEADRVALDHVTIDTVGENADGINQDEAAAPMAITNCSFANIADGMAAISVAASAFGSIGTSNTFDDTAPVELRGGVVDTDATWSDPGTGVNVTGGNISVDGNNWPVLTLEAGLNLRFAGGLGLDVGLTASGILNVEGTSDAPVTLTSLLADSSPGDWCGISIWENADASINYANIADGGCNGGSAGNISLQEANSTTALTVENSTITDSLGYGIYVGCQDDVEPKATFSQTGNTFDNNAEGDTGPGLNCTH